MDYNSSWTGSVATMIEFREYLGIILLCLGSAFFAVTISRVQETEHNSIAVRIFIVTNIAWVLFFVGLEALGL